MDISTPGGMALAKAWLTGHLSMIKDDGVWVIPRSYSVLRIISREHKTYKWILGEDVPTTTVLQASDWTNPTTQQPIKGNDHEIHCRNT